MTGNEIRQRFIDYFKRHAHAEVHSSGLIPQNDPTLMFTNAGMVQFKGVFLGEEKRDYVRAVSSQKCVRAGGKHNDLENVGRTARHHTFFEMLGNFSFGDYFKKEAIPFAWEFVTEDLGIDASKLLVTVYAEDDEAFDIWTKEVGLPEEKVIRIPTSDNFWSMGDTGPCGPCSEIFYDHGPEIPGGPPGSEDEDGDRFVEIWNLVFMQYNRDADGTMEPLPKPSIDTGAGLERIAALLQGKKSNYDSDLFQPLIQAAANLAKITYGEDAEKDVSLRVIADHLRASGFLITDGVLPSNEGRGYVLRRIMRRGMRHGKLLGLDQPFLCKLLPTLVGVMGEAFPNLARQQAGTAKIIEIEEKRFAQTLGKGLKILEEAVAKLNGGKELDGETVFSLYDTYGFPVDLTNDIVRDRGIALDMEGFESRMAEQRARARAAWSGSGDAKVSAVYHDLLEEKGATEFIGYVTEQAEGQIIALLDADGTVESLKEGEEGSLLANQTPFYGESGGQVGDTGVIEAGDARFEVTDTTKPVPGLHVHRGKVLSGTVKVGDDAALKVDHERRSLIRLHHSATHYLHHALRTVLGDHVKQGGSLVDADRLRFDFSHFEGMTADEVSRVEEMVNGWLLENARQETTVMTPEEAVEAGAMALFGEKYGDEVRVVRMGPTMELCGGTHVGRSGDIGLMKITSESAVAAGVRRIEAVCGPLARQAYKEREEGLIQAARLLKAAPDKVGEGIERLLAKQKELEKELQKVKGAMAGNIVDDLLADVQEVGGVKVLAAKLDDFDPKGLRELLDRLKDKLGSGVIFLGVPGEGKVSLIAGVTKDLMKTYKAGDIIKEIAPLVGGRGGGRPDMAQGGGSDPGKLSEAVAAVADWVKSKAS